MRAVYDVAVDHDAYLLSDEVYRLLAEEPQPPVASFGAHGISTTSLTKAYGLAGLRFGWIAGPEAVVARAAVEGLHHHLAEPVRPARREAGPRSARARAHLRGEPRAGGNEPRYRRRLARSPRPRLVRPGRRQRVRHGARWVRRRRGVLPGRRRDGERRARARRAVRLPGPLPDRVRAPTAELEEGLQRVSRVIEGRARARSTRKEVLKNGVFQ